MSVVIKTEKLTKKYGKLFALDGLNLEVEKGEVIGCLGPNGAGKTTTIRLLLGLIKPTNGRAEIFGLDSQKEKVEIHKRLSYIPGDPALWPNLTGMETLHLLGKVHGSVDLKYRDELIKRFKFEPNKKVRTYSKGNRQKLSLIAALMVRPELLVLDEPTSGLDPLMEQVFNQCIFEAKEAGQTVFLSSHILSEVEALCDRVAILRGGKLVEIGSLEKIRHLSAVKIEAMFDGTPPDVSKIKGVIDVKVQEKILSCQIHGSMQELIKVLADAGSVKILSREPSLEELFLGIYGEKENAKTEEIK
jgi:ABC-2 type transport system ATP-binding protein